MNVSFSAHAEAFLVERQTVAVDVVLFMWVLYTSSLKEFLIVLWCLVRHKRPFPSFPQSLCQSKSKSEIFVMVISSNFILNEN